MEILNSSLDEKGDEALHGDVDTLLGRQDENLIWGHVVELGHFLFKQRMASGLGVTQTQIGPQ